MSCNLFIEQNYVTRRLKEIVGSNETLYVSYISEIMNGEDISENFKKKLKENTNIDFDNIPNNKLETVVNYIQEYYNSKHPDINATVDIQHEFANYSHLGYTSVTARELGKRVSASQMLSVYHQILRSKGLTLEQYLKEQSKKRGKTVGKKEFFANQVTTFIRKEIINRLESRGLASKDSIMQLFKENNTLAIEKLFGNTLTIQDKNILAIYKEILGNRKQFFDEVFRDSRLGDIRFEKNEYTEEDSTFDSIEDQTAELNEEGDPTDGSSSSDDRGAKVDNSTEKFGDYNNYMTHVAMSIRSYLNSLKRLHSGNKTENGYDLNKDNELGIADTMNADEISSILYSSADFSNVDAMIESIRNIANTTPGFEALHQMADYLTNNRDFAYEIYNTYGKTVISKIETISDGTTATNRISNYSASKLTSLKFEFYNSAKATSILLSDVDSKSIYQSINNIIENIVANLDTINNNTSIDKDILADMEELKESNDSDVLRLIGELSTQLRKYYPTINNYSIANYINKANNGDIVGNLRKLNNILKATIDSSYTTQQEYNSRQAEIGKLYRERAKLLERQVQGERVSTKEIDDALASLYSQEYVSEGTRNAAFELAKELVIYSPVKTEFNSRNVHGNQSSDVINNSMITNIMKTLESTIALENFGKYKSQSRQYDFSNIMLEHVDENGKIINYGIFRQNPETNEWVATEYAQELLKARLFNGASDMTSDNNVLYAEMSKGDYIGTAFINYFNASDEYEDENIHKITFANYFMRIPSDAPKNFVIRAPKYSTKGLLSKDANGNIVVNTKHPIYQQFRNLFVQELTDAATAISKIFETKNGLILREQDESSANYGEAKFKPGFDNSKECARRLYAGYHVGKGKTILTKKDGRDTVTGSVFKSDRFTITTTENGKAKVVNYGNAILEEAFDILYGGVNDSYIHTTATENGIVVNVTEAQEAGITKHLSQFILDYAEHAKSRISKFKDFISEELYTNTNIVEFALNHHLMYASFGDLFEGDTKFYKDTQTFLKRAKEAQASGIPYGLTDYNMNLSAPRTRVMSSLNNTEFIHKKVGGTTEIIKIEQYNKFNGVTIKNTVRTGETIGTFNEDGSFKTIGSLSKKLIEALRESGMTLKDAKEKAAKMMSGYQDTTVNDAQSYITFEEWVRRVSARGQLGKYKPLIDAVLDETKPLDAETIGQFIQVQKNFYYDQHYNAELGVIAPRQIKNAEFVLVPRLIQGTQLEQVYKLMKDNNIDQLNTEETSKAGKANVLTIWNNEGKITQENIDDFNAHAAQATELYNYNYLYIQQETPQHMNAANKAGIQIMKKIVDNIDSNSPLYPLKQKFFELYSANIRDSFENLMQEFNLEVDENGNLKLTETPDGDLIVSGINAKVFYGRLKEEVARLGLDSNMMDYVTLNEYGVVIMPSFMSNVSTKLESIAQSIFNTRITRQKLPGFHAAQITNVGWQKTGDKVAKDKTGQLKYHPNGEPYVEIMLPKSNFNFKRTKKDGTFKTDEELLKELQDSGLDTVIGYRIPTEGKQSVCVMKVVAFTDDALGSTIVVPDDWVSQTGSDFDIDSVYGINYISRINKETGIIEKVPYGEETRDSRNNELLGTMINILSSPLSLEENLSRSNFDAIKEAKAEATTENENIIRKNRSPYNIFDQIDYQEDVMSGAKLKAFSVTRDTFCSICNTVKPRLAGTSSVRIVYKAEDGFTYKDLKKSFNNVEKIDDNTFIVTHDTFGWSNNNKNVVGELITTYSSQTTAHILDAVKEGSVPNVNELTFQVYKLFPDLGSDYKTAVAFMSQPGVTAIVDAYNSNKSIYASGGRNPINSAIRSIVKQLGIKVEEHTSDEQVFKALQKYNFKLARLFGATNDNFKIELSDKECGKLLIAKSRLNDRLNNTGIFDTSTPVGEEQALLFDLGVILQYYKLSNLGNSISKYARVCNPDKFGAKQTIFATNEVFRTIREIIRDEANHPVLTTETGNFIQAIYPGVDRGIDSFIQDVPQTSAYPPLYTFLKYATATSIKVNRSIFPLQAPEFVREIMKLESLFSSGKKINESVYKNFQNYILNHIYEQADIVSKGCTFVEGQGLVYRDGTNKDTERSRIFGYGKTPDLKVPDGNGNLVNFIIADINHPTQREINQFATLSPAQKVTWIQQTFRESGVFKYLRTSLFNSNRTGRAGMQTVQYVEGNANIETVYNEFEKCYFNNNPLIKLAAVDLIKYSFAVEGFKMRRNAVNKIIKNSVLYTNIEDGGTGIVSQINEAIKNITNGIVDMDILRENFIRSHSGISQISTINVKRNKDKTFEIKRLSDGIIYLSRAEATKHEILAEGTTTDRYGVDSYVKLKFGKDTTLYKIEDVSYGDLILYPVNTLEETESSIWSVNNSNNKYLQKEYYESIVEDYRQKIEDPNIEIDLQDIIEAHKEGKGNYRFKPRKSIASTYARSFNINDKGTKYTAGFEEVISKVTSYFSENPVGRLYVRSRSLSNFIHNTGAINGSIQKINGRYYTIQKVDFSDKNRAYIQNGREVKESNPQIQEIMSKAQQSEYNVNDAFLIEPYNSNTEEIRRSNVEESNQPVTTTTLGVKSMRVMVTRRASEGDPHAMSALAYLTDKEITSSTPSVKQNIDEVIRITAEYVENATEDIFNNLNHFVVDANDIPMSIDNPEVIDLIRNNPAARQKFLKTLLDARAFVRNYGIINELDIDAEDSTTKRFLEKIKNSINRLQNATIITNAERLFANKYLAKLSNNTNIQNDIHSLLDGYHSTSAFESWINDLQETSNPLLQIVTKEVMADIRSKEMLAKKQIREFRKTVADIKKRAREAGVNIDYSHIIDEYGKFIQDYNQAFLDKLADLRNNISVAKTNFGEGSIKHLKAKLEYDKWKLANTNQMLYDDYYRRRIDIEEYMINNFPTIYSRYQTLSVERRNILSHSKGVLDEHYQEELKRVKQEIDNLTNDYFFNQTTQQFENKYSYEDPLNPFSGKDRTLYSLENAKGLQSYLSSMKDLREEYFEQDAKFGFEEELERTLDIINNYEIDAYGNRRNLPTAELIKNDDYVKAKEWLENNARYVPNPELMERLNAAYKALNKASSGRKLLKIIAKKHNVYDSHGVINASLFTDEEIEQIRSEQLAAFNIKEGQPFSDRSLISNAPTDDTIFSAEFYRGMTSDGAKNQNYIAKVNEINKILSKYYSTFDSTLHTSEMSEEDINTLYKLYEELDSIKKTENSTNGSDVRKFIQDNVEFVYDTEKYERERNFARQKGDRYFRLWKKINESINENDNVVPNRYIYGYAKPKGYTTGDTTHKYVDAKKTKALRDIRKLTTQTKTQYYYQKYKEMRAKSDAEFDAWYEANHIYNPYTHTVEPLQCWTRLEVNQNVTEDGNQEKLEGNWIPNWNQTDIKPREDKLNSDYKVGRSTAANYKAGNSEYDNHTAMNDFEREIKDLFETTLRSLATTTQATRFLNQGYMISRAKSKKVDAEFIAKETAKLLGWINTGTGKETWYSDDRVDYANNTTIPMPMMNILKSKESKTVDNPPKKNNDETEEEFQKRVDEYNKHKKEIEEHNAQIHKDMLDNNWEPVIEEFITKAAHYNAVQDNKYMLFYAKQMIDKLNVYAEHLGFSDLKTTDGKPKNEENQYVTKKDKNLQEQYINWIRRLVLDQWKEPNNKLTRAANIMQGLTSAKFMMLNVTGGIANVTVGTTQILGESLAKEYFGNKHWSMGAATYHAAMPSFFADMYSEKATTLGSAVIKWMNVVDFDELTGVVHIPNASEYISRARDLAFSPQSMGEHLMQNGVMFAMMHSHRLVRNENKDKNGKTSYILMNEAEYSNRAHHNALINILTDEQRQEFYKFVARETSDANSTKEYARFRKDFATEFANIYLSPEQNKKFIKERDRLHEEAKKEFNNDTNHPTLFSQLKLGDDGILDFKEYSIFGSIGDEAYQILGAFKGRVISVNKKIHGVYDKLGAAQIESQWWGALVMQYHKHLFPGIMKRYRRQGYFNEERGTIEKGCYASLKDFLALPLHKAKEMKKLQAENGMTDAEVTAMKGLQNIVRSYVDFALHAKLNYQMMSDYDRANIRRAFGDITGVLSAVCFAIALRCLVGDDDDEGLVYNLMMYEADRLASESFMYNPYGLVSEGRKLWSSPVAFSNSITDLLQTLGFVGQWAIQGDEFDPYYKSGLYAGENKLEIKLKRNIPMYHGIYMLERLNRSNKYYKLGDNMLSIVPVKDIADFITD